MRTTIYKTDVHCGATLLLKKTWDTSHPADRLLVIVDGGPWGMSMGQWRSLHLVESLHVPK
jgi:hypothetical protein